jgi:hypothetical protein
MGLPLPSAPCGSSSPPLYFIRHGKPKRRKDILITLADVDLGKVTNTGDLDIIGCLNEMDSLQGTVGDGASTTTGLGTPSNLFALCITDSAIGVRWSPQAEAAVYVSIISTRKVK